MGRAYRCQALDTIEAFADPNDTYTQLIVLPLAEILMLFALPLLLIASGFFSGGETALFSLTPHQRLRLKRSQSLTDITITSLLANPRALLITLLITNTTVNVAYFVISTVLMIRLRGLHRFGAVSVGILSLATLVILILLGEVLPKLIAAKLQIKWSRLSALPLMAIHRALAPLRIGFNTLAIAPLARLIAPTHKPPELSTQELETILNQSLQRGVINHDEEHLLQQVLELSQLKVRDLMKPRVDIKAFNLAHDPAQLYQLAKTTRHSRIPAFRKDLDHIEGVILTRQLLLTPQDTLKEVSKLVRQIVFVPELQRADQLLVHFRKTGTTFAIAVDEFGGTAGLITLEDVVEHMVGDIAGPHEISPPPQVQQVQPGLWRVSADLAIHEWVDAFEQYPAMATFAGTRDLLETGVSTLGGMVMARLGRLPRTGDQTTIGNVLIEVQEMHHRRVGWLTIRLQNPSDPQTTNTPDQGDQP